MNRIRIIERIYTWVRKSQNLTIISCFLAIISFLLLSLPALFITSLRKVASSRLSCSTKTAEEPPGMALPVEEEIGLKIGTFPEEDKLLCSASSKAEAILSDAGCPVISTFHLLCYVSNIDRSIKAVDWYRKNFIASLK